LIQSQLPAVRCWHTTKKHW